MTDAHEEGRAPVSGETRVIQTERLGDFSDQWDDLVGGSPLPSPFLRSWWLDALADGDACFVLVVNGAQLLGGVPLEHDRRVGIRRYRLLGQQVIEADHLDLLARPGHEEVVERELTRWFARPGNRLLDFAGLVEGNRLVRCLPEPVHPWDSTLAPYATLPGSFDEYVERHPGVRKAVPRARRRLARLGAETRIVGADGIERALDDFALLHRQRWGGESRFLERFAEFRRAVVAGARRDEALVVELVAGGEVVATEVEFVVGPRMFFYQAGRRTDRDWRGSGNVVKAAAVEEAYGRGLREYDLLRGDEPYKQDWADDARTVVALRAAHGPAARLFLLAARARRRWRDRRGETRS